ncbi:MAG: (2Fe-2S)-binding protein [bacterium]|nr:(2Fe-2S)-binding protein [bacterium]
MTGVGIGGGALTTGVLQTEAAAEPPPVAGAVGPGEVSIALWINGKEQKVTVEPRVTLLDALRDRLHLTGAKRVCDRGTCGACTVIMDGKAVYACSVLAIDAQGAKIETVESMSKGGELHPVMKAFVENDAQQCGFCTPGFVVAAKAFLDEKSNPTMDDVNDGLGGNLCRCGIYMGVRQAVLDAAKEIGG